MARGRGRGSARGGGGRGGRGGGSRGGGGRGGSPASFGGSRGGGGRKDSAPRRGPPARGNAGTFESGSEDGGVYDDVDVFNRRREKQMVAGLDEEKEDGSDLDDDEAVMGVGESDGSDDDSDDDASGDEDDESGSGEEFDENKFDAQWGKKRSAYYNTDYVDADLGHSTDDDEAAEEEEREARNLQRKQAQMMTDADFEVPDASFGEQLKKGKKAASKKKAAAADDDDIEHEAVQRDVSALSKAEKLDLIAKDSPELIELLSEFRDKLSAVEGQLVPLLDRVKGGDVATSKGVSYLEVKFHLLLSYLVNIAFYLLLKAEGRSVKDHPVIAQLVSLRAVIEKLRPLDHKLKYQIDKLIRSAAGAGNGASSEDPLRFKPNLAAMGGDSDEDEDNGKGQHADDSDESDDADGKYVARKMLAVPYEDDSKGGKKRAKEDKLKQRALKSSVIRELRAELSDKPDEIKDPTGIEYEDDEDPDEVEHRRRYEEDNFIRLDGNKKRKGINQRRLKNELEELTDFGDIAALARPSRGEDPADQLLKRRSAAEAFATEENNRRKQQKARAEGGSNKRKAAIEEVGSDEDAYYEEVKAKRAKVREEREEANRPSMEDASEESVEGKRGINYQMQKNKGLTPRRKKEQRNPRLKHRVKYQKALIKRKSQVREYSAPRGPYGGESTGIRSGIVKSVPIK